MTGWPRVAVLASQNQHVRLQVLGTFITEWNVGSDICAAAFASQASAEEVALKLAAIAECYGFEGWLINIENTLEPANVQIMLHFLRCEFYPGHQEYAT